MKKPNRPTLKQCINMLADHIIRDVRAGKGLRDPELCRAIKHSKIYKRASAASRKRHHG